MVREQTETLASVRDEVEEKSTLISELEGKCGELTRSKLDMEALRAKLDESKNNERQLAVLLDAKENELKVGRVRGLK